MIKTIKRLSFSILMLLALTSTSLAQPGGGGGGGMGGGGGQGGGMGREGGMEEGQTIDLLAQAGYFEMDSEDIIKKVKVKKEAEKSAVRKAVIEFTKGYELVGQKYAKEIKAIQEAQAKAAKSQGDRNAMRTIMQGTSTNTQKIREEMVTLHKKLSEVDIPAAIDQKLLERWTKYYSSLCQTKGFRLNMPQRRQRGEGNQQGGQQGGGGR